MKIYPENFILNKNPKVFENNIFLISGNEETYIKKIEQCIINKFKAMDFNLVEKVNSANISKNFSFEYNSQELFNKKKIIIYYNPKNVDLDCLNTILNDSIKIIIVHTDLKTTSKIKKNFDSAKKLVSVSCYPLTEELKKLFLNNFLNENSIKLDSDSYWFFLLKSPNQYQLFENEMLKLLDLGKKEILFNDIEYLIPNYEKKEFDNLFFVILKNQKEIILETQKILTSSQDSFLFHQRIKFFLDIIVKSQNIDEAKINFPKYLFKERAKFEKIFSLTKKERIQKIFLMIKKSELMLKKYTEMHLSVSQRFLINLKKNIF